MPENIKKLVESKLLHPDGESTESWCYWKWHDPKNFEINEQLELAIPKFAESMKENLKHLIASLNEVAF